ncbi:methyltransferase domain-containing protein [Rhizobium sp. CFBP 8762]|uniref:phospholipid N-methyltransferase PmtA n=1 Tax=Rhizobium sp. CFBP 8762 TaxID=2775279 RepID=UPI001783EB48|nr:class I SAM-dependent methyltransferase [Rhizobium sp. CFBP 8762]MBD8553820.1 methyltransferase domain-containing protein [Rhizobium sp. CFBP 8762]
MNFRLKAHLSKKFDEEIRFFKGWMNNTKAVGAVLPTSSVTAKRMASVIDLNSRLPVLELGPGTGVITKAILGRGIAPANVVSVEYSTDFYNQLLKDYPGVHFINGDAFNLDKTLGAKAGEQFDCVISAVPLLAFPMEKRIAFIEDLLSRLPPDRPVVQITYSPVSPLVAKPESYRIEHLDFIVRNIPPAQLWIYRRPES